MIVLHELYNQPLINKLFGPLLARMLGGPDRAVRMLFTKDELARSQRMSFDELAEDALAAKYT
jgi:hypothetical protein